MLCKKTVTTEHFLQMLQHWIKDLCYLGIEYLWSNKSGFLQILGDKIHRFFQDLTSFRGQFLQESNACMSGFWQLPPLPTSVHIPVFNGQTVFGVNPPTQLQTGPSLQWAFQCKVLGVQSQPFSMLTFLYLELYSLSLIHIWRCRRF